MANVSVNFIHPTDGRMVTVSLDDTMTAEEAINELLSEDFLRPHEDGYQLAIKGGAELRSDEIFKDADVVDGTNIRIIPLTDAG
jgi:hypothetical protein